MSNKIRVLIVDDSALIRQLLVEMLADEKDIEVVATAYDPYDARKKIKLLDPDVLTLDVEMPKMDGITFLGNLMRLRPMPVVMVSSLTQKGAATTLQALEMGAIDFIAKPKNDLTNTFRSYATEIAEKIRVAANVNINTLMTLSGGLSVAREAPVDKPVSSVTQLNTTDKIIAIGASTGGTHAIKTILTRLAPDSPAVLVALHIPKSFSEAFADRLNTLCAMSVTQAVDGEQIIPGHAYIAPGGQHLELMREGARYFCRVSDEARVNRFRPSVDVLFRSVAQHAAANAVGVILTGMGKDGARGLKSMRDHGALTLAQDEASSVVWGMPGSAVRLDAVVEVLSLAQISGRLTNAFC